MKTKLPSINCKVQNLYNKNQFLIRLDTKASMYFIFQSYKSEIAIYNRIKQELYINEEYINYSKTTSKHLYIFINEYTRFSCHNLKELTQLIKEGTIKTYRR